MPRQHFVSLIDAATVLQERLLWMQLNPLYAAQRDRLTRLWRKAVARKRRRQREYMHALHIVI